MQDAVDAQFASGADESTGEDAHSGGDEHLVLDRGSVEVGVWPDVNSALPAHTVGPIMRFQCGAYRLR